MRGLPLSLWVWTLVWALLWPAAGWAQLPESPTQIKLKEAQRRVQEAEQRAAEAERKEREAREQLRTEREQKASNAQAVVPAVRASASVTAEPYSYFLQTGAFRSMEEAAQLQSKMKAAGFVAQITEREVSGQPVFRVRLGPYLSAASLEPDREKLRAADFDHAVVRLLK